MVRRKSSWLALGALACSTGCSLFKSEKPPWEASQVSRPPMMATGGGPTSTPSGAMPFGAPIAANPPPTGYPPVQPTNYSAPVQSPAMYHVGLGTPPQAAPGAPTQPQVGQFPPTGTPPQQQGYYQPANYIQPPQQMTGPGGVVIPPPVAPPGLPPVNLPPAQTKAQPSYGTTPGVSPALVASYPAPASNYPPTPLPIAAPGVPPVPPALQQVQPRAPYENPSAMPPAPVSAAPRTPGIGLAPAAYQNLPPAPHMGAAPPFDDFSAGGQIPAAPVSPTLDGFTPGRR